MTISSVMQFNASWGLLLRRSFEDGKARSLIGWPRNLPKALPTMAFLLVAATQSFQPDRQTPSLAEFRDNHLNLLASAFYAMDYFQALHEAKFQLHRVAVNRICPPRYQATSCSLKSCCWMSGRVNLVLLV